MEKKKEANMVSDYRVSNGWMLSNKSFPSPIVS